MSNQPSDPLQCPFCPIRMGDERQLPGHIELRHPSDQTVRDELRDQISRMACGEDYDTIWKDSVAAQRVNEAMRLHDAHIVNILEEIRQNATKSFDYEMDVEEYADGVLMSLDAAIAKYKEVS